MSDLVKQLRDEAEKRAEDRRICEFGPGGGNPNARAHEHLEWKAADEIERLRYPRHEVRAFARLMEKKLRKHDDRPGWKDETRGWLLSRLRDETEELHRAIHKPDHGQPLDSELIGREAADVANFAMMIADVCGALEADDE